MTIKHCLTLILLVLLRQVHVLVNGAGELHQLLALNEAIAVKIVNLECDYI